MFCYFASKNMCLKPETNNTVNPVKAKTSAAETEKTTYNNGKTKMVASTHSLHKRETKYDLLLFLVPALFWKVTPILPTYLTGIARMISTHLILTLHYIFVDKDNYDNKLTQKQVIREREDYLIGIAHDGKLPLVLFAVVSLVNNCFVFSTHLHIE